MDKHTVDVDECERLFVDGRQITVMHFYPIGNHLYAAGYVTPDGLLAQGVWRFNPPTGEFSPRGDTVFTPTSFH